jgi:recombination protein RecR
MIDQVPTLAQLVKQLQQIPYLASKNVYRVAHYFLMLDQARIQQLCKIILDAKMQVVACSICFVWKERERTCPFCDSKRRDVSVICVVETWQELMAIEKTGGYQGLYHILGGAICPLNGIGPENLTIEPLIKRVNDSVREIILATNQTPEGEATASYIASKLKDCSLKISCLARGVPVGSTLEYMDRVTVFKALSERRPF